MTEQNLIDAGFVREEGDDFHYYVYYFGSKRDTYLISCANDEADDNGWCVELFNEDIFRFYSIEDLRELIGLLEANLIPEQQ